LYIAIPRGTSEIITLNCKIAKIWMIASAIMLAAGHFVGK
jgi:hypothetical protein